MKISFIFHLKNSLRALYLIFTCLCTFEITLKIVLEFLGELENLGKTEVIIVVPGNFQILQMHEAEIEVSNSTFETLMKLKMK